MEFQDNKVSIPVAMVSTGTLAGKSPGLFDQMGVSENVVYPIVPNGFHDHYPYEKWLAIIGKINPTFSGTNPDLS